MSDIISPAVMHALNAFRRGAAKLARRRHIQSGQGFEPCFWHRRLPFGNCTDHICTVFFSSIAHKSLESVPEHERRIGTAGLWPERTKAASVS
jgi:hypothetical protein